MKLYYRSVTAIPLHPCLDNDTDWKFFSLETGMTFVRDYRYAYVMPWSYEARMRMRYLATLMPVSSDQSLLLAATPKEPLSCHVLTRRAIKIVLYIGVCVMCDIIAST